MTATLNEPVGDGPAGMAAAVAIAQLQSRLETGGAYLGRPW
jgi:hypothetical protein